MRNTKIAAVLMTTTMFIAAVACTKKNDEFVVVQETRTTSAETNVPAAKPIVLTDGEREFMNKAAQCSTLEVKLGAEAARRGSHPDVKKYGHYMMTDHGMANNELRNIATSKGVTVPATLDDDHVKKVEELGRYSTPHFDKEYANTMIDEHEEDIRLFEEAQRNAKDADLKVFIDKTLPTLRSHLKMANEMKAHVHGKAK